MFAGHGEVESADILCARTGVGWLVSRDVSGMERPVLRKTLADTLSENFTDAFVAPCFWLTVGGPVALWAYKAVSTMDSQWGYLTSEWRNLGNAAARSDDVLAWLPARLSVFILWFTNWLATLFPALKSWQGEWPGFRRIRRDAGGMPSPNSGWSMAACAWLAGGRMAGPSVYFGKIVHKGWIGPPGEWTRSKLLQLCRLMFMGSIIGAVLLWISCLVICFVV